MHSTNRLIGAAFALLLAAALAGCAAGGSAAMARPASLPAAGTTADGLTDPVLLEAIVKLGRSLGIETVAEGIEREEQASTLRRLGCRRAQGYLFSRPLPASDVPAFVESAYASGSSLLAD